MTIEIVSARLVLSFNDLLRTHTSNVFKLTESISSKLATPTTLTMISKNEWLSCLFVRSVFRSCFVATDSAKTIINSSQHEIKHNLRLVTDIVPSHVHYSWSWYLQIPTLYASIPIIVNVVFLLSNMFAVTGIILRSRQLLLPWLGLYLTRILFTASLAIYVVHLMPIEWFKAILALVVTPIIVLESALWTVILRFYTRYTHHICILRCVANS